MTPYRRGSPALLVVSFLTFGLSSQFTQLFQDDDKQSRTTVFLMRATEELAQWQEVGPFPRRGAIPIVAILPPDGGDVSRGQTS